MGKFVIIRSANGEFRFKLKAGNGEPILNRGLLREGRMPQRYCFRENKCGH